MLVLLAACAPTDADPVSASVPASAVAWMVIDYDCATEGEPFDWPADVLMVQHAQERLAEDGAAVWAPAVYVEWEPGETVYASWLADCTDPALVGGRITVVHAQ